MTDCVGASTDHPAKTSTDWQLAGQTTFSPSRKDDLAVEIVFAIADVQGVDPVDVDVPLYDYVDVTRIQKMFRRPGSSGDLTDFVEFSYEEFRVVVEADNTVLIYEPAA